MDAATGLENVTVVFTQFGTWVSNLVTIIVDKPLLLIPIGIFCFGATIGLAKRLIGR